jgi:hypothetical protein
MRRIRVLVTWGVTLTNCSVVKISRGAISLAELEKELLEIFYKEWSWQIRELTPVRFLVRFPPHKKVTDIMSLPSFNLRKVGVQVEVVEWVGDLDHFSVLKEVWIQVDGIPTKWCDYKVFSQIVSGFGLMVDVDWSSLFKSFYVKVRLKVACKNPLKIPAERLFEMDKKLYMINIVVEGYEQESGMNSAKDSGDDQGDDEED